ncbi:MAG: hypothetical protein IT426_07725 [Pirellulales bacterium]|nr:hypothetical protein [Pirellulales bacterium]
MYTMRIVAEVGADRQVILTLPPEVPTGKTEIEVNITPQIEQKKKLPRTSWADWAEDNAEHWGNRLDSRDVEGFTGRRF